MSVETRRVRVNTTHGHQIAVDIRSDAIWHTVYDDYDEPCATLERPHRGNTLWRVFAPGGEEIGKGYPMSVTAMRALAIWLAQ